MPENYIQPVTDRQQCYTCHKTVTGKKKLSKCSKCHAITYCSKKCQVDDFARHKWNCIPVMVTEYEGRGRGVIAARDIKMGEVIFIDKPVMKMPEKPTLWEIPGVLQSLTKQVNNMPSEAKLQYDKLIAKEIYPKEEVGKHALSIIADYSKTIDGWCIMFLNVALINHSCSPNATFETIEEEGETWYEVRAVKDISKGEEVTKFYARCGCIEMDESFTIKAFGSSPQERRAVLKKHFRFDCKCSVCSGFVPEQEHVIKEWLELHRRFDLRQLRKRKTASFWGKRKKASFWAEQVKIADKIVDLTLELYIGNIEDKIASWKLLLDTAAEARDQVLFNKGFEGLEKIAEDTGIRGVVKFCEDVRTSCSAK